MVTDIACPLTRVRLRSSDQRCRRLIASRIRKDASSITTAIAVASAYLNSSRRMTISSGAISETFGRLPAMKMTEPYSPTARAKASANPVNMAGTMTGRITRVMVCQRLAPSVAAASSTSASRSMRTGCTVRTTNGRPMKTSAT